MGMSAAKQLVIVGDYHPEWETHRATDAAIAHAQAAIGRPLQAEWVATAELTRERFDAADGLWIATGAPYHSMDNVLDAIRHAREHGVPCLGTCQGFQHLMLEFARSHLGLDRPGHAEYDPALPEPFIAALPCSLRGRDLIVEFTPGSLAAKAYGTRRATERYFCGYAVNPAFRPRVAAGPIRISGRDAFDEIRVVEYPAHPFMVGTLFVPQVRSQPGQPHPLVTAFLRAICA
jgi:CTP synthase (UTP-ammonia lyase)